MTPKKEHNKCGIYCIINTVNGKVYIGKSKNIYKRIHQHLYDLKNNRTSNENAHFLNSWCKYGCENFEYFVLELLNENEEVVKERELFWMSVFKSTNRNHGYNLRMDSSTKMITHPSTSKKISERLKKEWANGVRAGHSKKLAASWETDPDRKAKQSEMFKKYKTKYLYNLYNPEDVFIEICDYQRLKELKLTAILGTFSRRGVNKAKCKSFVVERVKIEDIVQSS